MTLVDLYGSAMAPVLVAVIIISKWCGSSVMHLVNDNWVLDLTRPIAVVIFIYLYNHIIRKVRSKWEKEKAHIAKTARANKVADFIAPFTKNLASKIQFN